MKELTKQVLYGSLLGDGSICQIWRRIMEEKEELRDAND